MLETTDSKKFNLGIISLIFSIIGVAFSFASWNEKTIGEYFINIIGVNFPVEIISLILLFISLFIGYKYKNNFFAKIGMKISIITQLYYITTKRRNYHSLLNDLF